jgi:hypothetical protein
VQIARVVIVGNGVIARGRKRAFSPIVAALSSSSAVAGPQWDSVAITGYAIRGALDAST